MHLCKRNRLSAHISDIHVAARGLIGVIIGVASALPAPSDAIYASGYMLN